MIIITYYHNHNNHYHHQRSQWSARKTLPRLALLAARLRRKIGSTSAGLTEEPMDQGLDTF
jgi:hypothetical protein